MVTGSVAYGCRLRCLWLQALAKYFDAEQKKDAEASILQLACAETPLSLDLGALQTAYDAAKVNLPTSPPARPLTCPPLPSYLIAT
mgnify:CR=1 FL=1